MENCVPSRSLCPNCVPRARARARVMARVGLGVWPRWLGFTIADPTPLCNGEKAYLTRLWVP